MVESGRTRVCLTSLGCPKNLVDSEVMLGILEGSGFEITSDEARAEVLVVNTCGFVGDAKEESIAEILRLADYKKTGACRRLVVTGCLSQRYARELAGEMPEVDCFVGTGEYARIAEAAGGGFGGRVLVGAPTYIHDHDTPRILSTPGFYAYVKVAEGCSNHCSYCSIPAIRGEFRSRPVESVVREAASLAARGVREINLVAQDTTSYGADRGAAERLPELLNRLVDVEGIEWIRLLYLYPGRLTDKLIDIIAGEEKVLGYVDLPLQHVSGPVLRAMNRRYDRAVVAEEIERLRERVPGVVLRTSLIVGFPGESESDFAELMDFIVRTRFDRLGVFRYSREESTGAYDMEGQVPERVKTERMNAVMEAQRVISLEKNGSLVGTELPVLVEGPADDEGFPLKGRAWSQAPEVDGCVYINGSSARPGRIIKVRVTEAWDYDLVGVESGRP